MNRIKTALELQVKFKQWITYRTRRSLPAVLFIGVFIFLGLSMITDMSGTTDEKYHLTRGIMYLNTGDPRINQHHPMLFNTYYAIPTLFDDDLVIPSETDPLWVNAQKDSISDELVKMNGGKVLFSQNVLFGPRALAIMTSAFLLYVIFRLVERSYGYKISLILLAFLSLSPTVIAHSALVTTDAPAMYMIFISTLVSAELIKDFPNKWDRTKTVLLVSVLTTALLTKYTAVFSVSLILIIFLLKNWRVTKGGFKKKISLTVKHLYGLLFPIFLLIFTAYSFQIGSMFDMTYGNQAKVFANVDGFRIFYQVLPFLERPLKFLFYHIPLPFPQYINGFYENVFKHNIFGHDSFLLGQFSKRGWVYYFPVTFIVKEYIGVVIVVLTGLITYLYKYLSRSRNSHKNSIINRKTVMVAVPILLAFLSLSSSINLGIRHFLPVYPFLFLGVLIWLSGQLNPKLFNIIIIILITGNIIALARQYPYYLEYFNVITGEPGEGYRFVRDSNFDWEQNEIRIQRYITDNPDLIITRDPMNFIYSDAIVISKEDLYPKPSKVNSEILELQRLYEIGNDSVKIGRTHLVIFNDRPVDR
ncbi:glycosyltransferase family 39 protein [Candidatus Nomurabacteria bacterium]|uniref:Glycosyltransferase family 39 protein n=1 Tax=Candidatus Dojkabacteria bacterium TaxID=2099670 RepID=A0A955I1X6_9BACT|nr:glycosyltransferase family 39 protein [Candidatus Dojkabacteria bacterium]MCB9790141.1 glycosyltransferase family 39 protein [Candidatus Nomurabacteria bacterium]MCB9803339.1 glycosyltransferase family 39 protein [Candidatus Nomurabacteria bacterium]